MLPPSAVDVTKTVVRESVGVCVTVLDGGCGVVDGGVVEVVDEGVVEVDEGVVVVLDVDKVVGDVEEVVGRMVVSDVVVSVLETVEV
jgi:hypothetical protein